MVCGCKLNHEEQIGDKEKVKVLKAELKRLQSKEMNKSVTLGKDGLFHGKEI